MSRFRDALAGRDLSAVAEVKRRSPSAGDLRSDADPALLASSFDRAGAAAISIIVDEAFGGSLDDLRAARGATRRPLLAKGFFRTEEDLVALRRAGADAALLILRDLDDDLARGLQEHARQLGMDALVEAHDAGELDRAVALGADPIGINARDLSTFQINREAQLALVAEAPRDRVVIAESGIEHRSQGVEAELAGAEAILVGSALMRAPDPAVRLAELAGRPLVKICGLTREHDVAGVAEAGADFAGFILAESPRRVSAPLDVPETLRSVSVFVGAVREVSSDFVQLYQKENGHRSRDGLLLQNQATVAKILDLPWESEDDGHWVRAAEIARGERIVLSGGLTPSNVAEAVQTVRPWCVDVSRGVESSPGFKDHGKVREFVSAVRGAA
ncbi:MAG: hypothetical protein ACRDH6_07685 [Actinomycetota bacterium]